MDTRAPRYIPGRPLALGLGLLASISTRLFSRAAIKEYLQRLQIRKERPSQLVIITGSTEPRRKLQRLLRYGRAICELTSRTTNSGETRQRTGTPLVPIPLVT